MSLRRRPILPLSPLSAAAVWLPPQMELFGAGAKVTQRRIVPTWAAPSSSSLLHEIALISSISVAAATSSAPPVLPPGIVYTNIPLVAPPGFTSMAFAPDGRIFVCAQRGSIHIAGPGLRSAFATLIQQQDFGSGENGLLGIAIDPGFETNSYSYIHYTVPQPDLHDRISRLTANGDVVKPCSERVLLEIEYPLTTHNHRAGALHFGPDGKLYRAVGDHFSGWRDAQALSSLVGKVLRINSDGSIPEDNPFYDATSGPHMDGLTNKAFRKRISIPILFIRIWPRPGLRKPAPAPS
jgi:hypothetical protein